MSRIFPLILTATVSLLMPALTAQCANIRITSLPFNITAPGTYVLTGNLKSPKGQQTCINISTDIAGPVVLDLKGFTIAAYFNGIMIDIGSISPGIANTYPITIRNGTLNPNYSIYLDVGHGILDQDSSEGNSYFNDTFSLGHPLEVVSEYPLVLNRGRFAPPVASSTPTALVAASAPGTVKISALPFNITVPGAYVLTRNLDASAGGINISTVLAGPVILDLKRFTITGNLPTPSLAVNIGYPFSQGINTFPITVRNGTVQNSSGINAAGANITIDKIAFIGGTLDFDSASSSTVSHCTFTNSGISDVGSQGGNGYINNSFTPGSIFFEVISELSTPCVLDRCVFAGPSN